MMLFVVDAQVSFVFSCQIDGKLKPIESKAPGRPHAAGVTGPAHKVEAQAGAKAGSTRLPARSPGLAWKSPLAAKQGAQAATLGLHEPVGVSTVGQSRILSPLHPNLKTPPSSSGPAGKGVQAKSAAGVGAGASHQKKPRAAELQEAGAKQAAGQMPKALPTRKRTKVVLKERAVLKRAKAAKASSSSEEYSSEEEDCDSQKIVAESDDDFD